jgi:hypothetical protein
MIKKKIIALLFSTTIGIIIFSDIAYTNNGGKEGKTGSPGENACNQCHNTNALNSGGGSVTISSPNMPNWVYFPGITYTINVKVKKVGLGKFGFGFEALLPSGANGGLIQTANSVNAKSLSATVLGNSRTNALHKTPNHFSQDSITFTFDWTAPAVGTGNITFYAAGNASNSGNNSSGDFIYTSNQLITEGSSVDIQTLLASKDLTIFPNPSSNSITINLPEDLSHASTGVQIFDVKGALVHSQNLVNNSNSKNISLDVAFLNDGVYFIHLENGNWQHHQKMMISK